MKRRTKTASRNGTLDVGRVFKEFEKAEASSAHREGTSKIQGTFNDALKKILRAKPQLQKSE